MDNFSRRFRCAMSRTLDRPFAGGVTSSAFVIGLLHVLNVPGNFFLPSQSAVRESFIRQ